MILHLQVHPGMKAAAPSPAAESAFSGTTRILLQVRKYAIFLLGLMYDIWLECLLDLAVPCSPCSHL